MVCGFRAGVQENWLITQHISRHVNSDQLFEQFSVKIEYEFTACDVSRHCKQSFDLYKWETSTISGVAARRTENYVKVGTFTPMENSNGTMQVNETINVVFTTEETGAYLALLDEGTCVVIHRLFVFYEGAICPDHASDLIIHPPILAPQDMVMGECVANSSTRNGLDPLLRCTDEGLWETVVPCLCNAGYESNTIEGVTVSCSGKHTRFYIFHSVTASILLLFSLNKCVQLELSLIHGVTALAGHAQLTVRLHRQD